MLYRPLDALRVSPLFGGNEKDQEQRRSRCSPVHAVYRYAQSSECRGVLLAEYFKEIVAEMDICGLCDNCRYSKRRRAIDASFLAWQVVQITQAVQRTMGRCSFAVLADLCRGIKVCQDYALRPTGDNSFLPADINLVPCGGRVELSEVDMERLIVQMLLEGFLDESFVTMRESVSVYAIPGRNAKRLSVYGLEAAQRLKGSIYLVLYDVTMNLEPNRATTASHVVLSSESSGSES